MTVQYTRSVHATADAFTVLSFVTSFLVSLKDPTLLPSTLPLFYFTPVAQTEIYLYINYTTYSLPLFA